MAMGMELMVRNLLKGLGVDAESIMEVAQAVQTYLQEATARETEILARAQRMEDGVRMLCQKAKLDYPPTEGEIQDGPGNGN